MKYFTENLSCDMNFTCPHMKSLAFLIYLPRPLNYKFLIAKNHVLFISVSPVPNTAPGM